MLFRDSMRRDIAAMDCCSQGTVIYSLWPGYLERNPDNMRDWALRQDMLFVIHHTSGHAHPDDLVRLAQSIAPKHLIPIHTLFPEKYVSLFPSVELLPNNQWASV